MNTISFQETELAAREAKILRLCEMELKFILLFQEMKSARSFCKGKKKTYGFSLWTLNRKIADKQSWKLVFMR